MYPGFGPQKIEMNKRTKNAVPSGEYDAMKAMMLKQAEVGTGMALEGSRNPKYGNVNYPGMAQGLNHRSNLSLWAKKLRWASNNE